MLHSKPVHALAIAGLLVLLAAGGGIFFSHETEAQPKFRNFQPPRNPVVSNVDHRFEFPGEIRNEVRRNQRQPGASYSGFVRVFDEYETVSVMIPAKWNDVEVDYAVSGDHKSGVRIVASSDLLEYQTGNSLGVALLATRDPVSGNAVVNLLDQKAANSSSACGANRFSRTNYRDPFFTGYYDFYSGCRNGNSYLTLVAVPGSSSATIVIEAAIRNEADLGAIKTVLESFELLGIPGHDHHHDDHEH